MMRVYLGGDGASQLCYVTPTTRSCCCWSIAQGERFPTYCEGEALLYLL